MHFVILTKTITIKNVFYNRVPEIYNFKTFSPEEEPVIAPKMQARAKKAVKMMADMNLSELFPPPSATPTPESTEGPYQVPPALATAASAGQQMITKLVFPSMSSVLQDVWVLTELGITLYQFGSAVTPLPTVTFKIIALTFAIINVFLASIDGFFYISQVGTCAKYFQLKKKENADHNEDPNEGKGKEEKKEENEEETRKCMFLSKEWVEKLETWFEMVRNILSEVLLYPLLIFDLCDFITSSPYLLKEDGDATNVIFFGIGCFYFTLAVYIVRLFVLTGSTAALTQMPIDVCNSQKDTTSFIVSFAITAVGQMLSQLTIIFAISFKIKDENPIEGTEDINASPFLITSIILGGVLPNLGIIAYFLVNYYSLQDMAMGIFINMMSLLQSENFAELVFEGDGTEVPQEKAKELVEKINLPKTRQQFDERRKAQGWSDSIQFSFNMPLLIVAGLAYYAAIIAFIASLMFGSDPVSGEATFVLFRSSRLCIAVFVTIATIFATNTHSIGVINIWIVMAVFKITIFIARKSAFLSPFILAIAFSVITNENGWIVDILS